MTWRSLLALTALLTVAGRPGEAARAAQRPPIQHLAFAGPALAGGAVLWGEEYRDGSLAVIRERAGGRAAVVHRIAAPTGNNRERGFLGVPGALSASSTWTAYGLDDAIVTSHGDSVSSEANARGFAARGGAAFRDLLPACGGAGYIATASEGDALAIGQAGADCGGRSATRVWLFEGDAAPRLIYQSAETYVGLRQVQLAGPWVAWSEGGSGGGDTQITIADRASGAVVARLRPRDFAGGRSFSAFDIDADGTVVALSGPQPRCYYVCVSRLNLRDRRSHTITRRAMDGSVAISGGRIAYVSRRGLFPRRLIVARRDGRVLRRLGRFGRSRRPIGDLALTRRRVAWAVVRGDGDVVPGARGSIHTARLP
jgi:hypothetical protein